MEEDARNSGLVPWKTKDIIYLSCVGPVFLAALLEWFLWLAAFCYCLCKAFRKADHWSQQILASLFTVLFVIIRGAFLPVMVVTLPLPTQITRHFPKPVVAVLQYFAFYSFAILLTVPWLICLYRVIVWPLGRQKLIHRPLDDVSAPKIVVVMPVYKEAPESLWTALNSVVDCDYPAACIHVFLSFDGDDIDELYLKTVDRLGIPVTMKDFPKSIDVAYNGARVTVSRFRHGGKRHCQKATFMLIEKIYKRYLQKKDDLFILFIDSDCILDPVCIQNFMYEMELKPGSSRTMLAMTGVITSFGKFSLITLLQDMEYIHGQMYDRSVESGCGSVTCLPGALTILRMSAFRNMAKFYFSDQAEQCEDLFDYGKMHLGEDRWLTLLFMLGAKKRYQIQMSTAAFCKTEAVTSFRSLLKQRRRWFLGFITNEVCMLTDFRIWRKYPLLCLLRFMQNTVRTTALLFTILLISVASQQTVIGDLPWKFICVSLGLNWLMMLYFAIRLHRFKAALYPVMFVLNPFMNWIYMVYGIFTAGQRTWGGPRADAGAADAKTSPQEAIEHAEATGDDLNVLPETFRPALEARRRRVKQSTLLPASTVEGCFAPTGPSANGPCQTKPTSETASEMDIKDLRRSQEDPSDHLSDSDISIHTPRKVDPSVFSGQVRNSLDPRARASYLSAGYEDIADPAELSRRLTMIAGHDGNMSSFERSPLGRTSPLTASNLMQNEMQSMHLEGSQVRSSNHRMRQRTSLERRKLQKRTPSPGSLV